MKKGVSLFESMFCFLLYGTLTAIILLNLVSEEAFVACLILTAIAVTSIYVYIITFSWRGLPKGCMYNPTGFIEIHVENSCSGNRNKFMKLCLDALLYGVTNKKNIMIDTWLIREKHIQELFGCAAEIYKPSIIQSFINCIFKFIYKNKFNRKCFRCIIYMNRLTPEQNSHILNHLTKLQLKMK